jgi:hypothetical protein
MFYRYRFESQIYSSLSRIPLHVRMKLDLAGLKISLQTWLALSPEGRWTLCHLPADTQEEREVFAAFLNWLCRHSSVAGADQVSPADPLWEQGDRIPDAVVSKARQWGLTLALDEWAGWNLCERYAVVKLSSSQYEVEKFYEAVEEFSQRRRSPE